MTYYFIASAVAAGWLIALTQWAVRTSAALNAVVDAVAMNRQWIVSFEERLEAERRYEDRPGD